MMKILFSLISTAIMFCNIIMAQTIKKIENLKDAYNLTYTYTGEVKVGKPNGMGVATYATGGNVLRYVGSFVNGIYNGKGTMLFDKGAFLTGNWVNGKLNGKGTNLTETGELYAGDFVNGKKNGKGILFYKDNSFVKAGYKDDKMSGRGINLWTDGNIISDIIYVNDKRNGTGYQYEAKTKKLYSGEWKDDKWLQAATPEFNSFISNSGFIGESTTTHVLMGPTTDKGFLKDTAFYYDLEKHKRYFGFYENGNIKNGLIIRDDSTRFIGMLNAKGAIGFCIDYKVNKYYSEGNYTNDLLNGSIVDIDLKKKSVYYGDAVDGIFTGKAYFFSESGTMYAGDYIKGNFTGNGYKLEKNGRFTSGVWDNGEIVKLTTLITSNGDIFSGTPKTFNEGLNSVIKNYPDLFEDISGKMDFSDEIKDFENSDIDLSESLVALPGSIGNNLIASDFADNLFYYAKFIDTDNAVKAKAKYAELAKQVQSSSISFGAIPSKYKLKGTTSTPDLEKDKTISVYNLSNSSPDFEDFHVWLILEKNDSGNYIVYLQIGKKEE